MYSFINQNIILIRYLSVSFAGILYPYAFAPYDFKFLAYLSLLIFFYILFKSSSRQSMKLSFVYGFFLFLFGVNWVFNSIYDFGGQHLYISFLLTLLFIFLLALIFIPFGFFVNKLNFSSTIHQRVIIGASVWVFLEWIRSNLFGGFPWLLLGYSQTNTYLEALFPLLGNYFIGFIVVSFILYTLLIFIKPTEIKKSLSGILILIISVTIFNIFKYEWTTHALKPINFSIIQANIKQEIKFGESDITMIKKKFLSLSLNKKNKDLIIWPETAIPTLYHNDKLFFSGVVKELNTETSLLSGVFRFDQDSAKFFNSLVLLNKEEQFYDKRHLVPFGEYVPFPSFFGLLAKTLNIPMSNLSKGSGNITSLKLGREYIYPLICYEIAYPNLININHKEFALILNISNDAWFGDSLAPYQHLQIAKVRALETQRYILRSANTGVSALIGPNGQILDKINFGVEGILDGKVYSSKGRTPYMDFGDYPILMLIFIFMFFILSNKPKENG